MAIIMQWESFGHIGNYVFFFSLFFLFSSYCGLRLSSSSQRER
jgi:LytS/YehU family sensor histidine kinase